MSSTSNTAAMNLQGMDVFWHFVKPQIQNRHEAALAIAHWILVSNGFRCIGRDSELPNPEAQNETPVRTGAEMLPDGWNDRSSGFYSLLYTHPDKPKNMFLLKLIPVSSINDSTIMGNIVMISGSPDVLPFELDTNTYIPENWQTITSPSAFPEFQKFVTFVKTQLIDKINPPKTKVAEEGAGHRDTSSGIGSTMPGPSQPYIPQVLPAPPLREFVPPSRHDPYGLGSRDLDPFGGFGGNIMGPAHFRPGGGMMPGLPGTGGGFGGFGMPRYDPMVPPELMPRGSFGGGQGVPRRQPAPLHPGEPDPDHEYVNFRPPGPGDDPNNMFM